MANDNDNFGIEDISKDPKTGNWVGFCPLAGRPCLTNECRWFEQEFYPSHTVPDCSVNHISAFLSNIDDTLKEILTYLRGERP